MSDWEEFDSEGLPKTPDYASHLRAASRLAAQTPVRTAAQPAPSRPYRPGYSRSSYPAIPAYDPAPRALTAKDVADYDRASAQQELQKTARAVRQDEIRIKRIEAYMQRDHEGYMSSVWHDEYSRLTGSAAESKERSR